MDKTQTSLSQYLHFSSHLRIEPLVSWLVVLCFSPLTIRRNSQIKTERNIPWTFLLYSSLFHSSSLQCYSCLQSLTCSISSFVETTALKNLINSSFHSRTGCPLPVSPAASPLALHCPTLSKQCFRFTLHLIPRRSRHVFRPWCLSSASIQRFLHTPRPRQLLQNFAIESSLLYSYTIEIPLFGRATGGPCNLYRSKRPHILIYKHVRRSS